MSDLRAKLAQVVADNGPLAIHSSYVMHLLWPLIEAELARLTQQWDKALAGMAEKDRDLDRWQDAYARLTEQRDAEHALATDWQLVADGVKHDWRCCQGEAGTALCLRCQVEALTAERDALNEHLLPLLRAFEPEISSRIPPVSEVMARIDTLRSELAALKAGTKEAQ